MSEQQQTFPREVLDLFDSYVHGVIDRRGFIERCTTLAGSVAAASGLLAALSPDFARAEVIAEADRRVRLSALVIPSPQGLGTIQAYVASPAKARRNKKPGLVLVIHENRGLNPHIKDIARRLAVDGFIAIAPDALTTLGGYPGDEDKAREAFAKLDRAKLAEDFVASARFALALPEGNGKLGAVGFCYGGGVVNLLATRVPDLRAGVPFYGGPAPLSGVAKIKAELLLQFGGNDTRVNEQFGPFEAALKAAGVRYAAHIYPNAEHGFNNDTTPRFNPEAAALAWQRTMALFKRTLA